MAKQTQMQKLCAALARRGEVKVQQLSRCEVWSRTHNLLGTPVPREVKTFYYVGVGGSFRAGPTRGTSRVIAADLKAKLLIEGARHSRVVGIGDVAKAMCDAESAS
jgi:hypothetical protein